MVKNKEKAELGEKKKGPGRPSLYEGKKKAINLKLTTDAIKILTKKSKRLKISRSDLINKLIFENFK